MHSITIAELIWQSEINERQACCRWEKTAFPRVDCIVKGCTWTHCFFYIESGTFVTKLLKKLLFFSVTVMLVKLCYCFGFVTFYISLSEKAATFHSTRHVHYIKMRLQAFVISSNILLHMFSASILGILDNQSQNHTKPVSIRILFGSFQNKSFFFFRSVIVSQFVLPSVTIMCPNTKANYDILPTML